jgi:(p)ppGpp synthase/HD superfamily hydrolase
METHQPYSRRRLQVVADADPGALARVVERLQNLNIIPRRVSAEFASNDILHIEVDVCGLPDEQLALIAGKIRQAACVVNAYWHRLD